MNRSVGKTNQFTKERVWNARWYWTGVLTLTGFGVLWMVALSIYEYRKKPQKNRSILYTALALLLWSVMQFGITATVCADAGRLPDLFEDMVPFWLALIPTIYLFVFYAIHAHMATRLSRCCTLIRDSHIRSVAELSVILGVPGHRIVSDVQKLAKTGELETAWVDEQTGMVEFQKSVWAKQKVTCKNCGASLDVDYGYTLVCEYCGGKLQYR